MRNNTERTMCNSGRVMAAGTLLLLASAILACPSLSNPGWLDAVGGASLALGVGMMFFGMWRTNRALMSGENDDL